MPGWLRFTDATTFALAVICLAARVLATRRAAVYGVVFVYWTVAIDLLGTIEVSK